MCKYLILLIILFSSCSNSDKEIIEFCKKNSNLGKYKVIYDVFINPFRTIFEINNSIRFADYDTSSVNNLKILHSEEIFDKFIPTYYNSKDELLNYVNDVYKIYKKLNVLAIFGYHGRLKKGYIEILLNKSVMLIYVVDENIFDLNEYKTDFELQNKTIIKIDHKWYYYRLNSDEQFDFYG